MAMFEFALWYFLGISPSAGSRGATFEQILTRYRDEVLATTPEGQFYTALYEQHSLAMMRASVADPSFTVRAFLAHGPWIAAIDALVDGGGDGVLVTQEMEDDLLDLLSTFESHGSPELATVVATERQRLQLDTIAGLSMTQFQEQVETLGGTSAVAADSWGRVKALHRVGR
jgi:hypothetical protein